MIIYCAINKISIKKLLEKYNLNVCTNISRRKILEVN